MRSAFALAAFARSSDPLFWTCSSDTSLGAGIEDVSTAALVVRESVMAGGSNVMIRPPVFSGFERVERVWERGNYPARRAPETRGFGGSSTYRKKPIFDTR